MSELQLRSVYELLGKTYFIPSYQRGYRWEKRQVCDLLEDLFSFAHFSKPQSFYCLQPIVVKKCDEETVRIHSLSGEECFEVIDGQQRLTTLYLLLKYLIREEKIDFSEDYGQELFRILYETHGRDMRYIECPEVPNDSSPDAAFITGAYQAIGEWFRALPESKGIRQIKKVRTMFLELLTNTKDESVPRQYGFVEVIWYETDDPDPIKTFTRLNIGKIPLKNDELIKALFVQKRDENDLSRLQQIQIAKEWDQMEAALQDVRFWAFLNRELWTSPTHIEFLFDVIFKAEGEQEKLLLGKDAYQKQHGSPPEPSKKKQWKEVEELGETLFNDKYGTDEYASFRYFAARFEGADREKIGREWEKVCEYFETFSEWYRHPVWYHYIGFLIYCGEPILHIYDLYRGQRKDEFSQKLVEAIRKALKISLRTNGNGDAELVNRNGDPVIYDNKTKTELKQLLVLYNIESILQKSRGAERSYISFPFDIFKAEKWDIEHVDSFTTNPLTEKDQQREWVKVALSDLQEFGIGLHGGKISETEAKRLEAFLDGADPSVRFEEIKGIVSKLAGEYLPTEVQKDIKNTIGNLTLLNADINRGYGNAIFPSKKKMIAKRDAEGRFIPIGTKNVFLKNFEEADNTSIAWTERDMDLYRRDILRVIGKFLDKEETHG